jgi:TRAP-type C4-dicarboxylate transport system permease small subunit
MKSLIASVSRAFTRIESAFFYLSAITLASIVLITCLDVGMRYFLRRPIVWSYPLTNTYLMPALFIFALSTGARYRDHISIDVLRLRMPPGARRTCELISDVAGGALALLVAVIGVFPLLEAWTHDERMPGENWALWPAYVLVPIGFGLLAVRFFIQAAETLAQGNAADDVSAEPRVTQGLD